MARLSFVWAALGVSALLATGACSGATQSELFGDDPGATSGGGSSGDTPTPAPTSTSTPSPTSTPPAPTSQPPVDAGGPKDPPKPNEDAGVAPCVDETEPNEGLATADTFAAGFCGKLSTNNDIDVASVTAPAGKTTMTFEHKQSAPVVYRLFRDGALVSADASGLTVIPVTAGSIYSFRMTLPQGSSQRPTYRIDVAFN